MYRKILNKTPLGFVEYMSELFQLCTGKMFSDRMCVFWEGYWARFGSKILLVPSTVPYSLLCNLFRNAYYL